jgi:DNA-directed RNA polymerase specialized sigma24 family protein
LRQLADNVRRHHGYAVRLGSVADPGTVCDSAASGEVVPCARRLRMATTTSDLGPRGTEENPMRHGELRAPNGDSWEVYGLMTQAAGGDPQAFSTLWGEHEGEMIAKRVASRELPEWPVEHADAVNLASWRTWKYLPKWLLPDKRRNRWAQWASQESLRAIQNFRERDLTQRATREKLVDPNDFQSAAVAQDMAESLSDRIDVRAVLAVMTEVDRELVLMLDVAGLNRADVAERFSRSMSWVDQHSRMARLAMSTLLHDDGIEVTKAAYREARKKVQQVVRPGSEMDERTSKKPDHRL